MDLEVIRTDDDPKKILYELSFDAEAGPANPDPLRKLRIRNTADNQATEVSFSGSGKPVTTFTSVPGSTRLVIEVVSPTEQKVHIPNDPRILMVRALNFRIERVRVKATPPAKPAQKAQAKVPALSRQ